MNVQLHDWESNAYREMFGVRERKISRPYAPVHNNSGLGVGECAS
jgi:hypothetical protein